VLAKQHAAAGRALTADLASRQPSIDRPYIDAAQPSHLAFRQKLLLAGVFGRHLPSFGSALLLVRRIQAKRTPRDASGTSRLIDLLRELDGEARHFAAQCGACTVHLDEFQVKPGR
jgi:hypothetical protein